MSKSLFEIESQYLDIIAQLEEDEVTPELEQSLQITQQELAEKCGNYLNAIATLESEAQLAKEYEQKAKAYRARKERAAKRLKNSLQTAVELFGNQKVGITELKLRKSESIDVYDIESLPSEFVKQTVTKAADKTAIKKAIKGGEKIDGASLITNQNLQIK